MSMRKDRRLSIRPKMYMSLGTIVPIVMNG